MFGRTTAVAALVLVAGATTWVGRVAGADRKDPAEPRPALRNDDGSNDALTGIAQVEGLGPSCTGFLLDTGALDAPAIVMTNGHCTGLFDSVTTITAAPGPDGAIVRFRKFIDTTDDVVDVPVTMVRYATMRSTDIAVLEIDSTLGALVDQGIAAYGLGAAPDPGDAIRVVGIPVQGVDPEEQVLRGDTCTAGSIVRLIEFEWLWDGAIASDCAGILGGNSGSPVFGADDSSTVVAIVNTTTIGAAPGGSCYLGQPCEVSAAGEVEVENRTYAMPVADWATCFAPTFTPEAPACPVEPSPMVTVDAPIRAARPGATWSATISTPDWTGGVALKSGPASSTDCRVAAGYGEAEPAADVALFDEPLPPQEGVYVLCAATVDASGSTSTANVGYAVMQVDATPPTIDIELAVLAEVGEDAHVEPLFSPPELSSFQVKFGPLDATDCSASEGYAIYRRVPILIPADELPATVCVIGEDEAGNRGEPQHFDVP